MALPSKKKVLVTGVRGFTGKHLADLLESKGYEVYGFVQDNPKNQTEQVVDITDLDSVTDAIKKIQPDFVVHLAAISFVAHEDNEGFYQVNLFGTLNLLKALEAADVSPKKIIIASSANIYGNPTQEIIDETVCPRPINHYANSKLAMENMVRTWFDKFPIIITRPFNYTGPGQSINFLVPKIVSHFVDKKDVISLGNTDVIRDISDVRFTAACYLALLESNAQSDIFNVCSGVGYCIDDILKGLTSLTGHEIKVLVDERFVRSNELKKLIGDNRKLLAAIPDVKNYSLIDNLKNMLESTL